MYMSTKLVDRQQYIDDNIYGKLLLAVLFFNVYFMLVFFRKQKVFFLELDFQQNSLFFLMSTLRNCIFLLKFDLCRN